MELDHSHSPTPRQILAVNGSRHHRFYDIIIVFTVIVFTVDFTDGLAY
jgi:hypothetical protein